MLSKKYARVKKETCVACGVCCQVCPKDAIRVQHGCYAQTDEAICVGCGKCAKICPTDSICVVERQVRG